MMRTRNFELVNSKLIPPKGLFGKKLVITPPMVDGDVSGEMTKEQAEEKRLAEKDRDNFRSQMQDFVGSDNVDGILHLEMEFDDDQKIEDVMSSWTLKLISMTNFLHTRRDRLLTTYGKPIPMFPQF